MPGKTYSWELTGMYTHGSTQNQSTQIWVSVRKLVELQSCVGEDLLGNDPNHPPSWKCYSLRMSTFFLIFYFFQVSCLPNLPCAKNHLLSWFCCESHGNCCACADLRCWNHENAQRLWWSWWWKDCGGILPDAMTAEKKLENITAPLKILKPKGNNRTE